jgi:glyceraldehyde 3-phosphate dehydrogenase
MDLNGKNLLGINGLGRIGKLTLWWQIQRGHFDGFIVNLGRKAGTSLTDVLDAIGNDSTYGPIERFLGGINEPRSLHVLDEASGLCEIQGKPVRILRSARNPKDVDWHAEGVRVVVDCTGAFNDPTVPVDAPKGSLRGHLEGGARVVLNSAPFKIKDKSKKTPEDAAMLIYGINHAQFDPQRHHVLSAASCTTTGLAHMLKPLLDNEVTAHILTASMSTIHAATNTQSVLDSVPSADATDLRKNRAVFDNIILSTTGAASALEKVLPAISKVGFMADSVRVPTSTVSLINLNLTFHSPLDEKGEPIVTRGLINGIYAQAAEGAQRGLLHFTERQNVSCDLKGRKAAVVIEGHENHTRTGFIQVPREALAPYGLQDAEILVPVTHAKIFGWYDNEFGSYTNCLGELTVYVDKALG